MHKPSVALSSLVLFFSLVSVGMNPLRKRYPRLPSGHHGTATMAVPWCDLAYGKMCSFAHLVIQAFPLMRITRQRIDRYATASPWKTYVSRQNWYVEAGTIPFPPT